MTYDDYAAMGIGPGRVFPVGGLYQEGLIRYPPLEEVLDFGGTAGERGSPGVSFWSYEHMGAEQWQAVERIPRWDAQPGQEEDEMSSAEFEQVNRSLGELSGRVQHLEAEVRRLGGDATAAPPRTYTVRSGDTLSGIAAHLGIADWRRLYDANRGVIGADPNRIFPGQVLVVP